MRGEFISALGFVLPNNLSLAGRQYILSAAFLNSATTFYLGLVTGVPTDDMTFAAMQEPTIGVNGYARVQLSRDALGWPTIGSAGSDAYIESAFATFAAVGGAFDKPIQRMCLCASAVYTPTDPVIALSAPLASPITIDPTTPLASRQFKYRIYA